MSENAVEIDPRAAATACGVGVQDLATFLRQGAVKALQNMVELADDAYVDNSPENVAEILSLFDAGVAGARRLIESAMVCERVIDAGEGA